MNSINHENKEYIIGDYVINNAPIYCKASRSARDLIKKKLIEKNNYLFARKTDDKWVISDGKSAKVDKVFFTQSFIDTIPELNKESNNKIADDKGIEKAPNLIHLTDDEKFKDNEGNIIEIETRGEREHDKIYFKVKDVAIGFEMCNLYTTLLNESTQYKVNQDYYYFNCLNLDNLQNKTTKKLKAETSIKKELFLTYEGILRVLFVSRNNKTSHFISWATKTLFTVQLGTKDQKDKLVSNIKGVSYAAIQELFSINARDLPCVYLTAFNTVSILRENMNIDKKYSNDSIVYKFGLTKSFEIRKNGHKNEYKKLDKLIDMKLIQYTYIDPLYISEAENEIKNMLEDYKITWDNHDELVIIPNNMLKFVKKIYENIGMKYSGHTQEFMKKINELENIISNFNKEQEYQKSIFEEKLKSKDLIIDNKDLIIENFKKELYIKELELQLAKK